MTQINYGVSERFFEFTFIRKDFEIQGCVRTEIREELYDQVGPKRKDKKKVGPKRNNKKKLDLNGMIKK